MLIGLTSLFSMFIVDMVIWIGYTVVLRIILIILMPLGAVL
jgi:hypothetical protein